MAVKKSNQRITITINPAVKKILNDIMLNKGFKTYTKAVDYLCNGYELNRVLKIINKIAKKN